MRHFAVNIFIFVFAVSVALCRTAPPTRATITRPLRPGENTVRTDSRVSQNAYFIKEARNYKDFNYQVFLNITDNRKNNLQCSGIIINEWYVLTAASCVDRSVSVEVIAGTIYTGLADLGQKGISRMSEEVYVHRNFTQSYYGDTHVNDIALIKLEKKWEKGLFSYLKIISLNILPRLCIVSGWGGGDNIYKIDSTLLRYTSAIIINKIPAPAPAPVPVPALAPAPAPAPSIIDYDDRMICASTSDTSGFCQADGGSPLVCGKYLTGIAGYSYYPSKCSSQQYCFTNVAYFESWIRNTIDLTSHTSEDPPPIGRSAALNEVANCSEIDAPGATKQNCEPKYFSKLTLKK